MNKKYIFVFVCVAAVMVFWFSRKNKESVDKEQSVSYEHVPQLDHTTEAADKVNFLHEQEASELSQQPTVANSLRSVSSTELSELADETQYLKQIDEMEEDISDMNDVNDPTDVSAIYENF